MARRLRHFEKELSSQDMLDVAPVGTIKRAAETLVINRHTGMCCILGNDAVEVLRGIKNIPFGALQKQLHVETTHLKRFIIQLYEYGLLSINGQSVLDIESDQRYPLSLLVLKLTNRCNLTCKYCYNEGLDGGTYIDGSHLELDVAFPALESALDACGPILT